VVSLRHRADPSGGSIVAAELYFAVLAKAAFGGVILPQTN